MRFFLEGKLKSKITTNYLLNSQKCDLDKNITYTSSSNSQNI